MENNPFKSKAKTALEQSIKNTVEISGITSASEVNNSDFGNFNDSMNSVLEKNISHSPEVNPESLLMQKRKDKEMLEDRIQAAQAYDPVVGEVIYNKKFAELSSNMDNELAMKEFESLRDERENYLNLAENIKKAEELNDGILNLIVPADKMNTLTGSQDKPYLN